LDPPVNRLTNVWQIDSRIVYRSCEMTEVADCVFCQIIQGKVQASYVYRDNRATAFLDIQPINAGHVLVIPNMHASRLADLDEEDGGHMLRVALRISEALLKSGVRCEGVNFHLADGEAAGQEIFHVHLHIYPRFAGDGAGLKVGPNYGTRPSRAELDETAKRIKSAMKT
jgi:histidine triad (HIT) family protein